MNLSKTVEKSGRLDENVSSFQRHGSRSLFPHAAEPVKATLRRAQRRRAIRVPFESPSSPNSSPQFEPLTGNLSQSMLLKALI